MNYRADAAFKRREIQDLKLIIVDDEEDIDRRIGGRPDPTSLG